MDGGYGGDSLVDEDEVITAIKMCIEGAFGKSGDQPYSPALVQKGGDSLVNTCLKNLAQMSKEYKWAVTCVVQQKTGSGLVTCCGPSTTNSSCHTQSKCYCLRTWPTPPWNWFGFLIVTFLFWLVFTGMFWDAKRDTRCSIAWENDKINVIVTVYAMAIDAGEGDAGGHDGY